MIASPRLVALFWLLLASVAIVDNCKISSRDLEQLRKDLCLRGSQIRVVDSGKVNWTKFGDGELEEFFGDKLSLTVPANSIISIDSKQLKVLNFGGLTGIKGPASARLRIVGSGVEVVDFSQLDIEIPVEIRGNRRLEKILFADNRTYNLYDVSHNPSLCDQSLHNFLRLQCTQQPVKNCDGICWDLADLEDKKTCSVLKRDLVVEGSGRLPNLYQVEEIHGRVSVIGNGQLTAVSETFRHLKRIEYSGTGPALELIFNKNLEDFTFPSFKKVTGGGGKRIVIKGNRRPMFDFEKKKLLQQTGLDEHDVDIPTVANWMEETAKETSHRTEETTTASSQHTKPEAKFVVIRTIIGGAVLFPIVIGSVIFIVYWMIVARRKTPKKADEPKKQEKSTGSRPTSTAASDSLVDATERGEERSSKREEEWTESTAPESTAPASTAPESTAPESPSTSSPQHPPQADNVVSVPPRPSIMPSYTVLAPPPKPVEPSPTVTGVLPATPGAVAMPPKKSLLPPVVLI